MSERTAQWWPPPRCGSGEPRATTRVRLATPPGTLDANVIPLAVAACVLRWTVWDAAVIGVGATDVLVVPRSVLDMTPEAASGVITRRSVVGERVAAVAAADADGHPLRFDTNPGGDVVLDYDPAALDGADAARICAHVAQLLEHVAVGAPAPLRAAPMLSLAERHEELVAHNGTGDGLVLDIVEAWLHATALHGGAPAVLAHDGALTYRRLHDRALALAVALGERGVREGDVVGVTASRSGGAIVSVLGILAAGGAYMPIDTTLPRRRIGYQLADAESTVVVSDGSEAAEALAAADVDVDVVAEPAGPAPPGARPVAVDAASPAYVIFTSGTTGRPKGVRVSRKALGNFVAWARAFFDVGPQSRFLQFAPLSFDASVWEIFVPLSAGGSVSVADPDAVLSPERLQARLAAERVTHCDLIPGLLAMLDPTALPDLAYCMTGGDAVPASAARRFSSPSRVVVNGYGPTEATDISVAGVCDPMPDAPPPIGRPIAGMQAYVVDEQMQPVPPPAAPASWR